MQGQRAEASIRSNCDTVLLNGSLPFFVVCTEGNNVAVRLIAQ
jgi:hypothetical protein